MAMFHLRCGVTTLYPAHTTNTDGCVGGEPVLAQRCGECVCPLSFRVRALWVSVCVLPRQSSRSDGKKSLRKNNANSMQSVNLHQDCLRVGTASISDPSHVGCRHGACSMSIRNGFPCSLVFAVVVTRTFNVASDDDATFKFPCAPHAPQTQKKKKTNDHKRHSILLGPPSPSLSFRCSWGSHPEWVLARLAVIAAVST